MSTISQLVIGATTLGQDRQDEPPKRRARQVLLARWRQAQV